MTLAVVLFSDATMINGTGWREEASIPGRLLSVGLPLTILLGLAAAAHGLTVPLDGSGFIAAWLTGLTLGALLLGPAIGDLTWEVDSRASRAQHCDGTSSRHPHSQAHDPTAQHG